MLSTFSDPINPTPNPQIQPQGSVDIQLASLQSALQLEAFQRTNEAATTIFPTQVPMFSVERTQTLIEKRIFNEAISDLSILKRIDTQNVAYPSLLKLLEEKLKAFVNELAKVCKSKNYNDVKKLIATLDIDKLRTLDPTLAPVVEALYIILCEAKLIKSYEHLIKVYPESPYFILLSVINNYHNKRFSEAIDIGLRLISKAPFTYTDLIGINNNVFKDLVYYLTLSKINLRMIQKNSSMSSIVEEFERAIALCPQHPLLYNEYLTFLIINNCEYEPFLNVLKRSLELKKFEPHFDLIIKSLFRKKSYLLIDYIFVNFPEIKNKINPLYLYNFYFYHFLAKEELGDKEYFEISKNEPDYIKRASFYRATHDFAKLLELSNYINSLPAETNLKPFADSIRCEALLMCGFQEEGFKEIQRIHNQGQLIDPEVYCLLAFLGKEPTKGIGYISKMPENSFVRCALSLLSGIMKRTLNAKELQKIKESFNSSVLTPINFMGYLSLFQNPTLIKSEAPALKLTLEKLINKYPGNSYYHLLLLKLTSASNYDEIIENVEKALFSNINIRTYMGGAIDLLIAKFKQSNHIKITACLIKLLIIGLSIDPSDQNFQSFLQKKYAAYKEVCNIEIRGFSNLGLKETKVIDPFFMAPSRWNKMTVSLELIHIGQSLLGQNALGALLIELQHYPFEHLQEQERLKSLFDQINISYLNIIKEATSLNAEKKYLEASNLLSTIYSNAKNKEIQKKLLFAKIKNNLDALDFIAAKIDIDKGIKLYPDNPNFVYYLAQYYYCTKNYQLCINCYDIFLKAYPSVNSYCYYERAFSRSMLKGDLDLCLEDLNKSISLNPHSTQAYDLLIHVLSEKKIPLETLLDSFNQLPKTKESHFSIIKFCFEKKLYQQVIDWSRRFEKIEDEKSDYLFFRISDYFYESLNLTQQLTQETSARSPVKDEYKSSFDLLFNLRFALKFDNSSLVLGILDAYEKKFPERLKGDLDLRMQLSACRLKANFLRGKSREAKKIFDVCKTFTGEAKFLILFAAIICDKKTVERLKPFINKDDAVLKMIDLWDSIDKKEMHHTPIFLANCYRALINETTPLEQVIAYVIFLQKVGVHEYAEDLFTLTSKLNSNWINGYLVGLIVSCNESRHQILKAFDLLLHGLTHANDKAYLFNLALDLAPKYLAKSIPPTIYPYLKDYLHKLQLLIKPMAENVLLFDLSDQAKEKYNQVMQFVEKGAHESPFYTPPAIQAWTIPTTQPMSLPVNQTMPALIPGPGPSSIKELAGYPQIQPRPLGQPIVSPLNPQFTTTSFATPLSIAPKMEPKAALEQTQHTTPNITSPKNASLIPEVLQPRPKRVIKQIVQEAQAPKSMPTPSRAPLQQKMNPAVPQSVTSEQVAQTRPIAPKLAPRTSSTQAQSRLQTAPMAPLQPKLKPLLKPNQPALKPRQQISSSTPPSNAPFEQNLAAIQSLKKLPLQQCPAALSSSNVLDALNSTIRNINAQTTPSSVPVIAPHYQIAITSPSQPPHQLSQQNSHSTPLEEKKILPNALLTKEALEARGFAIPESIPKYAPTLLPSKVKATPALKHKVLKPTSFENSFEELSKTAKYSGYRIAGLPTTKLKLQEVLLSAKKEDLESYIRIFSGLINNYEEWLQTETPEFKSFIKHSIESHSGYFAFSMHAEPVRQFLIKLVSFVKPHVTNENVYAVHSILCYFLSHIVRITDHKENYNAEKTAQSLAKFGSIYYELFKNIGEINCDRFNTTNIKMVNDEPLLYLSLMKGVLKNFKYMLKDWVICHDDLFKGVRGQGVDVCFFRKYGPGATVSSAMVYFDTNGFPLSLTKGILETSTLLMSFARISLQRNSQVFLDDTKMNVLSKFFLTQPNADLGMKVLFVFYKKKQMAANNFSVNSLYFESFAGNSGLSTFETYSLLHHGSKSTDWDDSSYEGIITEYKDESYPSMAMIPHQLNPIAVKPETTQSPPKFENVKLLKIKHGLKATTSVASEEVLECGTNQDLVTRKRKAKTALTLPYPSPSLSNKKIRPIQETKAVEASEEKEVEASKSSIDSPSSSTPVISHKRKERSKGKEIETTKRRRAQKSIFEAFVPGNELDSELLNFYGSTKKIRESSLVSFANVRNKSYLLSEYLEARKNALFPYVFLSNEDDEREDLILCELLKAEGARLIYLVNKNQIENRISILKKAIINEKLKKFHLMMKNVEKMRSGYMQNCVKLMQKLWLTLDAALAQTERMDPLETCGMAMLDGMSFLDTLKTMLKNLESLAQKFKIDIFQGGNAESLLKSPYGFKFTNQPLFKFLIKPLSQMVSTSASSEANLIIASPQAKDIDFSSATALFHCPKRIVKTLPQHKILLIESISKCKIDKFLWNMAQRYYSDFYTNRAQAKGCVELLTKEVDEFFAKSTKDAKTLSHGYLALQSLFFITVQFFDKIKGAFFNTFEADSFYDKLLTINSESLKEEEITELFLCFLNELNCETETKEHCLKLFNEDDKIKDKLKSLLMINSAQVESSPPPLLLSPSYSDEPTSGPSSPTPFVKVSDESQLTLEQRLKSFSLEDLSSQWESLYGEYPISPDVSTYPKLFWSAHSSDARYEYASPSPADILLHQARKELNDILSYKKEVTKQENKNDKYRPVLTDLDQALASQRLHVIDCILSVLEEKYIDLLSDPTLKKKNKIYGYLREYLNLTFAEDQWVKKNFSKDETNKDKFQEIRNKWTAIQEFIAKLYSNFTSSAAGFDEVSEIVPSNFHLFVMTPITKTFAEQCQAYTRLKLEYQSQEENKTEIKKRLKAKKNTILAIFKELQDLTKRAKLIFYDKPRLAELEKLNVEIQENMKLLLKK